MKHKVRELEGAPLDAAVAHLEIAHHATWSDKNGPPSYSTDWSLGGPIIERERIALVNVVAGQWEAYVDGALDDGIEANPSTGVGSGPTALIASMRAYVAAKLGPQIELP